MFDLDLHEQKRPLHNKKLCKTQSQKRTERMIMVVWATFQIFLVKDYFQLKNRQG